MSAERIVPGPVRRPAPAPSAWRQRLASSWVLAFVVCLGAGAFLGLSHRGRPLWPQALILWAPAGLLLLVPGGLLALGRLRSARSGSDRATGSVLAVLGLGLVGVGLAHLTHAAAFYALALPALTLAEVWLLGVLAGGPNGPRFDRARRRGGPGRQRLAYLGAILIAATLPFLMLAAVGLVDLARA